MSVEATFKNNTITATFAAAANPGSSVTVVNDLTTGGTSAALSAQQGVVLKGLIDTINSLLTSDDASLDTLQEIVNLLKSIDEGAEMLALINTALGFDLETELSGKADKAVTISYSNVLTFSNGWGRKLDVILSANDVFSLAGSGNISPAFIEYKIHPNGFTPDLSAFINENNSSWSLTNYNRIFFYHDGVNVSYTLSQLEAASDITAPTLQSATVEDATKNVLDLVFDEAVTITSAGWNIDSDGSAISITGVSSGSGTTAPKLTLSREVVNGEVLNIDYNPATGNTVDTNSNELEQVTDFAVTNNVAIEFSVTNEAWAYHDFTSLTETDGNPVSLVQDESPNNRDLDDYSPATTPNVAVRTINSQSTKTVDCLNDDCLNLGNISSLAQSTFNLFFGIELQDGRPSVTDNLFGMIGATSNNRVHLILTSTGIIDFLWGNATDGLFRVKTQNAIADGAINHFVLRIKVDFENDQISVFHDIGGSMTSQSLDPSFPGSLAGATPGNFTETIDAIIGNANNNGTLNSASASHKYFTKFAAYGSLTDQEATAVYNDFII